MPTGKRLEPIIQYLPTRLRANRPRNQQYPLGHLIPIPAHSMRSQILQIRFTPIEQIRPRFAEQILHAARKQQGRSKGQGEAHPSGIPFPEPTFPERGADGAGVAERGCGCGSGDEGKDEGDDCGSNEGDKDEG